MIQIQTADAEQEYRVVALEIIDSREQELVVEPGVSRISLVTCYPFDAPFAGGPFRYVVTAIPTGEEQISRQLLSSSG